MKPIAVNLAGVVETPSLDSSPYRVDRDGRPYVPIGDGGIALGVHLGDDAFGTDADHAAPGACLIHPEQPARHALTSYACLGNPVEVRSGAAAGERGVVLGKRGEEGRVIACFADDVLDRLAPGDAVAVRGWGQGGSAPAPLLAAGVAVLNVSPAAIALLPIDLSGNAAVASVRAVLPSTAAGNGIGRPAHQWDLDLQVHPADVPGLGLGDLVALEDVDVRHNAGYRRGWVTVGIVVHGSSPQPGHGPGLMPLLCGPLPAVQVSADVRGHTGLTLQRLLGHRDGE
ncbi:MAG: DUF4438 family protein [Jatrophihabitans sp.]